MATANPVNLKAFITPDRVILGLETEDRSAALERLIEPLIAGDIVVDKAQFLEDLERREAEYTTMTDNGIAIPHARSQAVRRLGISVGLVSGKGIQFDPESDTRCHLLFCIAVPAFAPTSHMPLLQAVAKFGRDTKRVEKILVSKTQAVAARYLASYKS
jgi:mannitol/fructose-specific phosphotransferase system IIA component (Ntr-type)